MRALRDAWIPLLALAMSAPASTRADDVPVCSADDRQAWKAARLASLGVAGSDRDRNLLPDALPGDDCLTFVDFSMDQEGRANDGFHSWVYAAGCKQTFCGRPASFEKNLAFAFLSGELDLNNNLVPVGESRKLLEDRFCFESHLAGSTLPAVETPRLCFPFTKHAHVEITPPRGLRDLLGGLWIDPDDWTSWRKGLSEQQMCVYGPFVGDTGHALKAEIHPTQLFWWNENAAPLRHPDTADGPYALFLVQDASSRYSKRHHFVLENPLPAESTWRPWAQGPVHGRFEIPFWVERGKPVNFRLFRYDSGRRAPPAEPVVRVPGRIQDGPETVDLVFVENETKLPASYRMDILPEVLCKECQEGADCRDSPKLTRGYRAKLVIDAEVGRDLEWEEGHLALLLCDKRTDCGAGPRDEEGPLSSLPLGPLQSLVTWKAERGSWRSPSEGQGSPREAIDRMFERVGWPEATSHPYPALRRLDRVGLRAEAAIPGLEEKEEKRMKTTVEWGEVRACTLLEPAACDPLRYEKVSGTEARLELPRDPAVVRQVELTVTVGATLPDLARAAREGRPISGSLDPRTDRWTLWSHGFEAGGEEFWNQAVADLCAEKARQSVALEKMRLWHALPGERGSRAGVPPVEPLLPLRNVRHLVRTMVADGVVTMAELRTLVEQAGRLCGFETPPRARTPQWQAAY